MKLSEALQGLGRPIPFYPRLARCLGSIPAALLLAQLIYWRDKQTHDYLYKTAAQLETETGISAKAQRTARTVLRDLGILKDEYFRLGHELRFTLDLARLDAIWEQFEKRACDQRSFREVTEGQMAKRPMGVSSSRDYPETTPGGGDVAV